jgi:uncharacterized protein
MRAVLDTNVLVSALLRQGSPPDLLHRAWLYGAFELVTSQPLLDEFARVLARDRISQRIGRSAGDQSEFVRDLAEVAIVAVAQRALRVVDADPADNAVLEAAVGGSADYVVSGDRHLLDLGEFEGIRIVTPARFLAILTEEAMP